MDFLGPSLVVRPLLLVTLLARSVVVNAADFAGAVEECQKESAIRVGVTVFGVLGSSESAWRDAPRGHPTKWVFTSLMRSMLTVDRADQSHVPSFSEDRQAVSMREDVIEAYDFDRVASDTGEEILVSAVKAAPRSSLRRTRFAYELAHMDSCSAFALARSICHDYVGREEEELIYAILRNLEKYDLYPFEGMAKLVSWRATLKSVIRLHVAVANEDGITTVCGDEPPGDDGGPDMFMLPDCPAKSLRCGEEAADTIGLCDASEIRGNRTLCKCEFGLTGFFDLNSRNVYEGSCTPSEGFCLGDGDMADMVRRDGSPAKGIIQEVARPRCQRRQRPDGSWASYRHSMTSTCIKGSDGKGRWSPTRQCELIPPKPPPSTACLEPVTSEGTYARNCEGCVAGDESCMCEVGCLGGYLPIKDGETPGPRRCIAKSVDCPDDKAALRWLGDTARPGERCLDLGGHVAHHDFCCPEAWGTSSPPEQLDRAECQDLDSNEACLVSMQDTGPFAGRPCCWTDNSWAVQFMDEEAASCMPQGAQAGGLAGVLPATCASSFRDLSIPGWDRPAPVCKARCSHAFDDSKYHLVYSEGCDFCVVGDSHCDCSVHCDVDAGFELWMGGGIQGARKCDDTGSLGPPPVCRPRPPPERCLPPPTENVDVVATGCGDCRAGLPCDCRVECLKGSAPFGEATTGAKACLARKKELPVATCEDILDEQTCRSSRSLTKPVGVADGDDTPCCWRGAHAVGPRCVTLGSPILGADEVPDVVTHFCASSFEAHFEPFPDCRKLCNYDSFRSMQYVVASSSCANCFAGEACACEVKCAEGTKYDPSSSKTRGKPPWTNLRCSANGQFDEVPQCVPPETDARPPICPPIEDASLEAQGCANCAVGGDCDCIVNCSAGHRLVSDLGTVGRKSCVEDFHPCPRIARWDAQQLSCTDGEGELVRAACCSEFYYDSPPKMDPVVCKEVQDNQTCLTSMDRDTQKACCWRSAGWGDGVHCVSAEDKLITTSYPMEACADRPRIRTARWAELMPTCIATCRHDFANAEHVTYSEGCGNCVPGSCACEVNCMDGYLRIGGGMDGSRERDCATPGAFLQEAPLCWPKENPTCALPPVSAYTAVGSCNGCIAGAEPPCTCNVSCHEGYRMPLHMGVESTHACTLRKTLDVQFADTQLKCSDITSEAACLDSKEFMGDSSVDWEPCCWRPQGFMNGRPCARRKSAEVKLGSPPEQCATMYEALWTPPLPDCRRKCARPEGPNLVADGCDDCVESDGDACPCQVNCTSGTMTRGLNEGRKRCVLNSGGGPQIPSKAYDSSSIPTFENLPVCEVPCAPADNVQGTLNVSGCQSSCLPGIDNCCFVQCAPGLSLRSGTEGFQSCIRNGLGAPSYTLPTCLPKCATPSDDFKTRIIAGCAPCEAGGDCDCAITCVGKRTGGGMEGKYRCALIPGEGESWAQAKWVWHDSSKWGKPLRTDQLGHDGWDQEPQCLAPIKLMVIDAQTKMPLQGIKVTLYRGLSVSAQVETVGETGANGIALFHTIAQQFTLGAVHQKYVQMTKTMDRLEECGTDPKECVLKFSMTKVLQGAFFKPEGCTIALSPQDRRWEMRAVLAWTEQGGNDLDLWARSWSCADAIARRYNCTADTDTKDCKIKTLVRKEGKKRVYKMLPYSCCRRGLATVDSEHAACEGRDVRELSSTQYVQAARISGRTRFFDEPRVLKIGDVLEAGRLVQVVEDMELRKALKTHWGSVEKLANGETLEEKLAVAGSYATYIHADRRGNITVDDAGTVAQFLLDSGKQVWLPLCAIRFTEGPDVNWWEDVGNQFPKWVHWRHRFQWKLDKRLSDGIPQIAPGAESWTQNHHIVLDVDDKDTGPETITFRNVPPGRYQLAAHLYQSKSQMAAGKKQYNIANTMPSLRLYIKGTDNKHVEFVCNIPKSCKMSSRLWNIVNVNVVKLGRERVRAAGTDAAKFQKGNYVMVTKDYKAAGGAYVRRGLRGVVLHAPTPLGTASIQLERSQEILEVPEAELENYEVQVETEKDLFSLSIYHRPDPAGGGLEELQRYNLPTGPWADKLNKPRPLSRDEAMWEGELYWPPIKDKLDKEVYNDDYIQNVCKGQCSLAKGSEAYKDCLKHPDGEVHDEDGMVYSSTREYADDDVFFQTNAGTATDA
eukprot:TRINITY_DN28657_c0_g3_i1.p1 TRINITY_DN28657_c0_g3~~TRINITY_DN28657_c0_g3_i1.p1  ORF type:complete len:2152 (-),score=325.71 TRINITY_DN28657_c0_g3_i1:75-6530(-)